LIQTGTSLGMTCILLLLYPAQSSHHALGRAERLRPGHRRQVAARLSVGIEDAADIMADLD
jgi:cystathionine beta-lyase/cystathionine gamma-synthase